MGRLSFPWKQPPSGHDDQNLTSAEPDEQEEEGTIEETTSPHRSFIPKKLAVIVIGAVSIGIGGATYFSSVRQQQHQAAEAAKSKAAEVPQDANKRAEKAREVVNQAKAKQEKEQESKKKDLDQKQAAGTPSQDSTPAAATPTPQPVNVNNGVAPAATTAAATQKNGQPLPPPPPVPTAYNPTPLTQTAAAQGGDDAVRQRAGAIIALSGAQGTGSANPAASTAANAATSMVSTLTNTVAKNLEDQAGMMPLSSAMSQTQGRAFPLTMSMDQVRDQLATLRSQLASASGAAAGNMPSSPAQQVAAPMPSQPRPVATAAPQADVAPSLSAVAYDGKLVLRQGSLIPAVSQSAINSDLAGEITALVTENVYDSVGGTTLLIPKGAKLVASYGDDVRLGQARVMINFTRLMLPNGSYIMLRSGMNGVDTLGRSGMDAEVDNHFLKMFGAGLVAAVITWGTERADSTSVTVNNPSGSTDLSGPTAKVIKDLTDRVLDRYKNIQPTLTVEPGEKLKLFVKQDMLLPAYPAP